MPCPTRNEYTLHSVKSKYEIWYDVLLCSSMTITMNQKSVNKIKCNFNFCEFFFLHSLLGVFVQFTSFFAINSPYFFWLFRLHRGFEWIHPYPMIIFFPTIFIFFRSHIIQPSLFAGTKVTIQSSVCHTLLRYWNNIFQHIPTQYRMIMVPKPFDLKRTATK